MKIKFSNAGKRFNREWIFRHADFQFNSSSSYAITGPNGSGKSTMLQCIGGMLQLSEGKIDYAIDNTQLINENVYPRVSFCAPYLDVIEEMTFIEFLQFHNQFKSFINNFSIQNIIEEVGLKDAINKQIRYYSSGMKQRVKLAQAIFSDASIILLDEPCSNLDAKGIDLYHSLIKTYCSERLVIVCSNDEVEYSFTNERISVLDYKK
ncbi:MAG TPA: ATP-binding cassette domain-containing protein [Flavisolibacter sp.]|jgi:ABC-type multidrug transport system ATPase subunit|nr:ATP-binding cassette domain-containing protein [Flavisolibacter sp.]